MTSTSTVGLPRLSRISRAVMSMIVDMSSVQVVSQSAAAAGAGDAGAADADGYGGLSMSYRRRKPSAMRSYTAPLSASRSSYVSPAVGTGSSRCTSTTPGVTFSVPRGFASMVPWMSVGITGTPAAMASTNGPFLNGRSAYDAPRVPSG